VEKTKILDAQICGDPRELSRASSAEFPRRIDEIDRSEDFIKMTLTAHDDTRTMLFCSIIVQNIFP